MRFKTIICGLIAFASFYYGYYFMNVITILLTMISGIFATAFYVMLEEDLSEQPLSKEE